MRSRERGQEIGGDWAGDANSAPVRRAPHQGIPDRVGCGADSKLVGDLLGGADVFPEPDAAYPPPYLLVIDGQGEVPLFAVAKASIQNDLAEDGDDVPFGRPKLVGGKVPVVQGRAEGRHDHVAGGGVPAEGAVADAICADEAVEVIEPDHAAGHGQVRGVECGQRLLAVGDQDRPLGEQVFDDLGGHPRLADHRRADQQRRPSLPEQFAELQLIVSGQVGHVDHGGVHP